LPGRFSGHKPGTAAPAAQTAWLKPGRQGPSADRCR
jgi:hypothetical protein